MSFLVRKARSALFALGIGALVSYFMDSELGRQRRRDVVDRASGLVAAVRDERRSTRQSGHGDADPTGGAAPHRPHLADREDEGATTG
jgi:hypothetical protein